MMTIGRVSITPGTMNRGRTRVLCVIVPGLILLFSAFHLIVFYRDGREWKAWGLAEDQQKGILCYPIGGENDEK